MDAIPKMLDCLDALSVRFLVRWVRLSNPRIESDRRKRWASVPVRLGLSLVRASQYMRLSFVVLGH
jgi:hypothetical protein